MNGDTVIFEQRSQVYRVATASGKLLGTEFGGNPLAFETAREAQDMIERRREHAEHLNERSRRTS